MIQTTDFKVESRKSGCQLMFYGPGYYSVGLITWENLAKFTTALTDRCVHHPQGYLDMLCANDSSLYLGQVYIGLVDDDYVYFSIRARPVAMLSRHQTARLIIELYIAPFGSRND